MSTGSLLMLNIYLSGVLAGDGESAAEIVHYMNHVLNVTNLNEKILKGLTLQLVVQNYPKRNKFAAVDSGI